MVSSRLVIMRSEDFHESTDVECLDCYALVVTHDNEEHSARYHCDSCDQEIDPRDIGPTDWDKRGLEHRSDNNINTADIDQSYIG